MYDPNYEKFVKEKGAELHRLGFNCAECVLLAVKEWMNWSYDAVPRVATGFGGGIGRSGNLCGAATGAIMSLGLTHGRNTGNDKRPQDFTYRLSSKFIDNFKEEFDSLDCRDISKVNFDDPEDIKRWMASGGRERCTDVIIKTLLLLEPYLSMHSAY